MRAWPGFGLLMGLIGGCGGDARVELSAADALGATAEQMERTILEYHQEVTQYDDAREAAVAAAFVARVRKDADDESAVEAHAAAFEQALRKVRADRETEWTRRAAALDNVGVLREVSRGLRKTAIESLSLQDEMKRYLTGWIEARRRREEAQASPSAAPGN